MGYIDQTLEKYGIKIKGWTYTGQPYSPDDPVRDENGMVTTAGSIYCPEDDTWQYKPAKVHNGRKQRGLVVEEKNYHNFEGTTRLKNKAAPLRFDQIRRLQVHKGSNKRKTNEHLHRQKKDSMPYLKQECLSI